MTAHAPAGLSPCLGPAEAVTAAQQAAVAGIEGMAELMHEVRAATVDLQAVLGDLLAKSGERGQAADPLGTVRTALGELVASMARVSGELGAARLDAACREIRSGTRDIVRSGLEFQMVAKLTASTIATLPARTPELEAYAETFGRITDSLSTASLAVEAQLGRILAARADAVAEFGRAGGELDRVAGALAAEAENRPAPRSGSGDSGAAMSSAAEALQACARAELGRMVEAMQFTDAFAQRCEHVAAAFALAEAAAPARAKALYRVALALGEDLVAGMRASSGAVSAALGRFAAEGAAARGSFEARLESGDLAAALSGRGESLARAVRQVSLVAPRFDAIQTRTREIEGLAAEANRSLAELVRISARIMLSSVNAGLIASRISSSGGPLAILAAAAQTQSVGCSRRIGDCSAAVATLIETTEALDLEALRLDLEAVGATASRLVAEAREVGGATASLDGVRARIAGLIATVERIAESGADRLAVVEVALAGVEAALTPARAVEAAIAEPAGGDLADLRALYTMQREREIHDGVLGLACDPAPEPGWSSNADELDDILF